MRRLAQVVLSIWFAATTSFFQACAPALSNSSYHGSAQTFSSAGNSALPADNWNATSGAAAASPASASSDESFDTTGYNRDPSESEALTSYLKQHRLPLVGAQVMKNSSGDRAVVLYGFVATPFGKSDAAAKARNFLKDSNLTVSNRVHVQPELLSSNGSTQYSGSASTPAQEYADQQKAIQQYEQQDALQQQQQALQQYGQQQNSALSTMLPLLLIAGMIGMGFMGGGGSFGSFGGYGAGPGGYPGYPGGFGYPGYPSPSPYSPYPGYGSPFSSPFP